VPQLLSIDEEFRAIEMTIVRSPFLLDFADARLDEVPDFTEDVLGQWEEDKADIFGEKWPEVTRILAALQAFGIYLLDISPRNISCPEREPVKPVEFLIFIQASTAFRNRSNGIVPPFNISSWNALRSNFLRVASLLQLRRGEQFPVAPVPHTWVSSPATTKRARLIHRKRLMIDA
jgi:hypothetical protein